MFINDILNSMNKKKEYKRRLNNLMSLGYTREEAEENIKRSQKEPENIFGSLLETVKPVENNNRSRIILGTDRRWANKNPILLKGEVGVEVSDNGKQFKIGDGIRPWNELPTYRDNTLKPKW